jgi:hypothetical protein
MLSRASIGRLLQSPQRSHAMSRTGGHSAMSDRDVKGGRYTRTLSMITPRGGRKGGGCERS